MSVLILFSWSNQWEHLWNAQPQYKSQIVHFTIHSLTNMVQVVDFLNKINPYDAKRTGVLGFCFYVCNEPVWEHIDRRRLIQLSGQQCQCKYHENCSQPQYKSQIVHFTIPTLNTMVQLVSFLNKINWHDAKRAGLGFCFYVCNEPGLEQIDPSGLIQLRTQ